MAQSPKTSQGGASLSSKIDSVAYTISASSLTVELEAVTHALCWISSRGGCQTTQAIILIVYTDGSVTKDKSGWGFTDKQGATTIHEDSAASNLTMKVEAVTHALR